MGAIPIGKMRLEDLAIRMGSDEKARGEYERMQGWWGGGLKLREENLYCQMFNPLFFIVDTSTEETQAESYRSAILCLIKHPEIFSVSINNKGIWRRVQKFRSRYIIFDQVSKDDRDTISGLMNISGIDNDNNIRTMARIAANDKYHYNYMELTIGNAGPFTKRPLMGFVQYEAEGGRIVIGYELSFPFEQSHFFPIRTNKGSYETAHALWVPEKYMDLPSPASMRKGIISNQ